MKTKQFIHEISALSLTYKIIKTLAGDIINIYDSNDYCVGSISLNEIYQFDTLQTDFDELPKQTQDSLFDLLVHFSKTPISERHETSIEENVLNFILHCLNENIPRNTVLVILESSSLHYRCLIPFKMKKPHNYEELKNNHVIYEFYCKNSRAFNNLWTIEEYKMNKGE